MPVGIFSFDNAFESLSLLTIAPAALLLEATDAGAGCTGAAFFASRLMNERCIGAGVG